MSVGLINPLAAHAFSLSEQIETQLRSGKSNTVSADAAPWIRQKTGTGDTIIGARAILNQGLEMSDAVFLSSTSKATSSSARMPRVLTCGMAIGICRM